MVTDPSVEKENSAPMKEMTILSQNESCLSLPTVISGSLLSTGIILENNNQSFNNNNRSRQGGFIPVHNDVFQQLTICYHNYITYLGGESLQISQRMHMPGAFLFLRSHLSLFLFTV